MRGHRAERARRADAHAWPGNVRELQNVIERAVLLSRGPMLDVENVGTLAPQDEPASRSSKAHGFRLPATGLDLQDLEVELVIQALERTGGNQTRAAALLGLNRDQIRYRMAKFGLKPLRMGKDPQRPGLTAVVIVRPATSSRDICGILPASNEKYAQG